VTDFFLGDKVLFCARDGRNEAFVGRLVPFYVPLPSFFLFWTKSQVWTIRFESGRSAGRVPRDKIQSTTSKK
jgi:hypothetical protein